MSALQLFLSYNRADAQNVVTAQSLLKARGITTFLDRDNLSAGLPWPQALEEALRGARGAAVFIGRELGGWQKREMGFALDWQVRQEGQGRVFPVIPVLLPGADLTPGFLFLNTWIDLRGGVDGAAAAEALDSFARTLNGTPPGQVDHTEAVICPYRGLQVFREEDAAFFFGRKAFADRLLEYTLSKDFVAVVGPSGSGKSSVVQAGLLPLLRRERPPAITWDPLSFTPGADPFHRLASAFIPLLEPDMTERARLVEAEQLGRDLAGGKTRVEAVVSRVIEKSNGTGRLLLVADQFEELFTLTPERERRLFTEAMLRALGNAPFTLLITLRADFYGHAISLDRRLSDRVQTGLVNLGPLTREETRLAVEKPAAMTRLQFESGLVDRLLDHVDQQPGGLPLLEFTLTELWERRDGGRITHAAYEAIGQVGGAISQRAESVFQTLDAAQKQVVLARFTRLVRVSAANENELDTSCGLELLGMSELERSVLQKFVDARLLVLNRVATGPGQTVQLAHEALIHNWSRLGKWVDEQREFLLWRQRLGYSVAEWQRAGQDKSLLLRGPALKEASTWARDRKAQLSPTEEAFIRRGRTRQQRRRLAFAVAIALAILIAAAYPALRLVGQTNAFIAWSAVRHAQVLSFPYAELPSSVAEWIHAADVAGRLDEVGSTSFLGDSPPTLRARALMSAADLMAYEGRTTDANRLVDRALQLDRQEPNFDSALEAQLDIAEAFSRIGREMEARTFALRAVAFLRQENVGVRKAVAAADAARVLAQAGLAVEARVAIDQARESRAVTNDPEVHTRVDDYVAEALVRLGDVEEALKSVPMPVRVSLIQTLVDRGYLKQARDLANGSKNPVSIAIVASALAAAGQLPEGRALTRTAFALLETPDTTRDNIRLEFQERLLLKVMTAKEATEFVAERGRPEEMVVLALTFARTRQIDLSNEMANAAARAAAAASKEKRGRVLVTIAEVEAIAGQPDRALSSAREIEDRELQAAGLAYAAYGFATQNQKSKADALLREVTPALPAMHDQNQRSAVELVLAKVQILEGNYSAAERRDDGFLLYPDDQFAVDTAIVRDTALRRNGALRDRFDNRPVQGIGRYGVDWP